MVNFRRMLLGLGCGAVMIAPSYGGTIDPTSILSISGSATVNAASLTWNCNQPGDLAGCAANAGDFTVSGSTGTFAQYNNTFGQILDINNVLEPLNSNVALMNFITFDLNGNEKIELTFIPLGSDTQSATCAGVQHCTPTNAALITPSNPGGVSAFNLDQSLTGTSASFGVIGTLFDSGGSTASIAGIFTAQFAGETPQQVLSALSPNGIPSTYSANFNLTITPEPTTIALMGAGLFALGLVRRRQKQ